jgi:hypothetical protein
MMVSACGYAQGDCSRDISPQLPLRDLSCLAANAPGVGELATITR